MFTKVRQQKIHEKWPQKVLKNQEKNMKNMNYERTKIFIGKIVQKNLKFKKKNYLKKKFKNIKC